MKHGNFIMMFFGTDDLPSDLVEVVEPFRLLVEAVNNTLPHNPETENCLRKLLEAKDSAVRSALYGGLQKSAHGEPTPSEPED